MKPGIIIIPFLLICCILAVMSCSTIVSGGSAGETGNARVAGILYNKEDGTVAAHAKVALIPSGFNPISDASKSSTTTIAYSTSDDNGRYEFTHVNKGNFNIEATAQFNGTKLFISNILVTNDTNTVQSDSLRKTGVLCVTLPYGIDTATGYVFVPGTTIFSFVKNLGVTLSLMSVPAGQLPSLCYATTASKTQSTIRNNIFLKSGDTTTITNPSYLFAKKFYLNTQESGADVLGSVSHFPLLVRLSKSNFNFSAAKQDGSDILFTKKDNSPLCYSIERFDPVLEVAELWVSVDSIYGYNSTQYIEMFWGTQTQKDQFDTTRLPAHTVFDLQFGWTGVWHLDEQAKDTTANALFVNSVENTNYGDDRVLSSLKTGIIGAGQSFLPGDRIQITNATSVLKGQTITISAWVKADSVDYRSSEIASMGDNYMLRIHASTGSPRFVLYSLIDTLEIICEDSLINIVDKSWHHVSGSYDGKEVRLYVDGQMRKSVSYTGTIPYTRGNNFVIGNHGTNNAGFSFIGSIDEVECANMARSADWIKLLYENQRINSKLINTN